MADANSPFMSLLSRQLELLAERREVLCGEIAQIDAKLATVAKAIGVDPDQVQQLPVGSALPLRQPHHRSDGSMAQFIRDFFAKAEKGHTRAELKQIVRDADERFEAQISHNVNGFYNAVKRMVGREIVDIDGVLYPAARAPRVENTHLPFPDNVRVLKTATDQ